MKIRILKSEKGIALVGVLVFTLIFTILGLSMLNLSKSEILLTKKAVNKTKAFYLAEAGLGRLTARLHNKEFENLEGTALGEGSYQVAIYLDENPPYAISSGKVGVEEKSIKVELSFLARPYEEAVYIGNASGQEFTFTLRGKGDPTDLGGGREVSGKDVINGNIFADRAVALYEESGVNPALMPNSYGLQGDVDATNTVSVHDSASISGVVQEGVVPPDPPDLLGMNYQINNTHNVAQIFAGEGVDGGRLPSGHELYDVIEKNPSDMSTECAATAGDDYFLEPAVIAGSGDKKSAVTPLDLGDNRVYYVDGNVWIHNKNTYGMLLDGQATIVATGNIYICDNTKYKSSESLMGLVALGKHDSDGQIVSGGNIYFGDPRYGTTYTVSGLMFAANDFLYNTDSVTGGSEEPETGFSVYGNLGAMNHVSIRRDWYDDGATGDAKPAYFNPATNQWVDMESGLALTSVETDSIRHYQMKVSYDERVRTQDTQPPGLPKGPGAIFAGLTRWGEL